MRNLLIIAVMWWAWPSLGQTLIDQYTSTTYPWTERPVYTNSAFLNIIPGEDQVRVLQESIGSAQQFGAVNRHYYAGVNADATVTTSNAISKCIANTLGGRSFVFGVAGQGASYRAKCNNQGDYVILLYTGYSWVGRATPTNTSPVVQGHLMDGIIAADTDVTAPYEGVIQGIYTQTSRRTENTWRPSDVFYNLSSAQGGLRAVRWVHRDHNGSSWSNPILTWHPQSFGTSVPSTVYTGSNNTAALFANEYGEGVFLKGDINATVPTLNFSSFRQTKFSTLSNCCYGTGGPAGSTKYSNAALTFDSAHGRYYAFLQNSDSEVDIFTSTDGSFWLYRGIVFANSPTGVNGTYSTWMDASYEPASDTIVLAMAKSDFHTCFGTSCPSDIVNHTFTIATVKGAASNVGGACAINYPWVGSWLTDHSSCSSPYTMLSSLRGYALTTSTSGLVIPTTVDYMPSTPFHLSCGNVQFVSALGGNRGYCSLSYVDSSPTRVMRELKFVPDAQIVPGFGAYFAYVIAPPSSISSGHSDFGGGIAHVGGTSDIAGVVRRGDDTYLYTIQRTGGSYGSWYQIPSSVSYRTMSLVDLLSRGGNTWTMDYRGDVSPTCGGPSQPPCS